MRSLPRTYTVKPTLRGLRRPTVAVQRYRSGVRGVVGQAPSQYRARAGVCLALSIACALCAIPRAGVLAQSNDDHVAIAVAALNWMRSQHSIGTWPAALAGNHLYVVTGPDTRQVLARTVQEKVASEAGIPLSADGDVCRTTQRDLAMFTVTIESVVERGATAWVGYSQRGFGPRDIVGSTTRKVRLERTGQRWAVVEGGSDFRGHGTCSR